MRIKRVECEQFAGLTGKELEFEKGLNLVIGENESGKSTFVDLIYQMLFQDVKIGNQAKEDKEFRDRYFPKKAIGPEGDVIDGVLVFETPSGTFKLKKEWEKGKGKGSCRLTLPDGTSIKENAAINRILAAELKHRAGVFSEIVFASQKRNQAAIKYIMHALQKNKDSFSDIRSDLTSTLTQVALETGGVSLEKIEETLKGNMDKLIGRWDWDADAPEGGPKKASYKYAWLKGAGEIVKAYYEEDEVRSKQREAENAERAVEAEKTKIQELRSKKKEIEDKKEAFQKYRGIIGLVSLLRRSIGELEGKINEQKEAYNNWPGLNRSLDLARNLRKKLQQAQVRGLYSKAEPVYKRLLEMQAEAENLKEVDTVDLERLENLNRYKQNEQNRLTGMNLAAKIRKLGSTEITITSTASGEAIDLAEGEIQIMEAVNIRIPGIMDMQLMPKGVDVEDVKRNIETYDAEIEKIQEKYGVSGLRELSEMSKEQVGVKQEIDILHAKLTGILGDISWEVIKTANDAVPAEIETENEIRTQIKDLCGAKTVDSFIGGLESTIEDYQRKYKSVEELEASISGLRNDKKDRQDQMASLDKIPEEYQTIRDPEKYNEKLLETIKEYENQIDSHINSLREAERKLGDKSAEEYSEELQEKEAILFAKKAEYKHWMNIYRVFLRLKEQSAGNPVEDIEARFREYLKVITDGSLRLDSMDEKMSVQLASGPYSMTYDILSDGTKDTISLAFRLAMLEHLYPEGNGLAVFDDPFTDMDAKRVEQSCRLIQKYAENNQVIFVTCDRKYQDYMSGKVIPVDR